jgi:7-carboxy-7-deazaguanine synthase
MADLAVEKVEDPNKKLPLIEVFGPTIQGEGYIAGQVSYFLRLGVCSYRCAWCDQPESVIPEEILKTAKWLTQNEIYERVTKATQSAIKGTWLTISGGDPLSHNLSQLTKLLQVDEWLRIAVETQGAIYQDWLRGCDLITVSPKPPSSGMSSRTNLTILDQYQKLLATHRVVFKIVVFNNADADFAEEIHSRYPHVPLYLSSGTPQPNPFTITEKPYKGLPAVYDNLPQKVISSYQNLAKMVLKRPKLQSAIILPQLHVLLEVQ